MRKEFEEMKEKKLPLSKWDLIVLGVVLILVVALICVICIQPSSPTVCKIYKDGKCVKTVKLSDFSSGESFGSETLVSRVFEYNGVRILVYADGVEVEHSNCYDEACVSAKKITKKGECIECTPSRIAVTLE